jgi:DNA-binding transcriptional ArsR family regulator
MSQPAISKHLKMLERAGLISRGRDAQRRPARLEGKPLEAAHVWLERFKEVWEMNFTRLDTVLEELQDKPTPRPQRRASGRQKRS